MPEPQFVNSIRSEGNSSGQEADNLMKKAMATRIHDRLAQIENHRASFRRHLSRAKNSDTPSGLSLGPEISIWKTDGKERKNRRRVVNFALPKAGYQWERKNGNDITVVRQSKSSGYGSDTDRWNTSGDSSAVSTRDDPHLAAPSWRTRLGQEDEEEAERGRDWPMQNEDSNKREADPEEIGEEEIRRVSATFQGLKLLSQLEEEQEDLTDRRRQAPRINREKSFTGQRTNNKHSTALISWATSMSTKSGGTRGSDEGSLDSNPAVNFLMRRYAFPEDEWTRQARKLAREKICSNMDLPAADRLARIATLRQNVQFIEGKFKSLLHKQRAAAAAVSAEQYERTISVASGAAPDEFLPSRFTKSGEAKSFFRARARLIIIVKRWINMVMDMNKNSLWERQLKTFVDLAIDMEGNGNSESTPVARGRLSFDKNEFKANKEISLSMDVKTTLSTRPDGRTPEMIKQVMLGLQTLQSLGEYPLDTQQQLCKVAWFQQVPARKYIIRQGHKPEAFYFILSGTAVVKKIEPDPATGEEQTRVVARLSRGQSFGELGLIFKTPRNATVESGTAMELLVVGKEDFLKIFMHNVRPGEDPDHIAFLKQQPVLKYWPFEVLKEDPSACLINYFKRGTLVTESGKASEWIYFIKSGSCEALKRLKPVTPRTEKDLRRQTRKRIKSIQLPDIPSKLTVTNTSSPKQPLHPEIYRSMTDFFDEIRMKSEDELRAAHRGRSSSLGSIRRRKAAATTSPEALEGLSQPSRKHSQWEITGPAMTIPSKQVYFKRTPPLEDIPLPPIPARSPTGPGVSQSKFCKLTQLLNKSHLQVPTLASIANMYTEVEHSDQEEEKDSAREDREDIFVTVEKLQARDIFGMNTISFEEEKSTDEKVPEVALVSRGAEIVMLSKRTYLKYADERDKLAVQELITPYPGEEQLQENLQVQANWDMYRQRVLEDVMYLNYAYKRTFSGLV
ncbi:hypothetical protein RRG08_008897 [Elysia crispata]|uniref:Cyclic nucleotide-binding domain-containing protein n=1 Tax=Elysia crispata TaxID=231223 RepID=A0AAE1DN97_9GAST|nr:hypothetical protein RRG08_008897 [Elysia crispata]